MSIQSLQKVNDMRTVVYENLLGVLVPNGLYVLKILGKADRPLGFNEIQLGSVDIIRQTCRLASRRDFEEFGYVFHPDYDSELVQFRPPLVFNTQRMGIITFDQHSYCVTNSWHEKLIQIAANNTEFTGPTGEHLRIAGERLMIENFKYGGNDNLARQWSTVPLK